MKTKFITLLLAVAASIGTMHAAIINGTCGENLTWSLNTRDSTLTIEGSGMMTGTSWSWWDGSNTPWSSYCSYIKYASLPNGLTSIGAGAFSGCGELASVTIPSSVTSIGDGAFANCTLLTTMVIPDGVTGINYATFKACSNLTSIYIPNGVVVIDGCAFYDCNSLTSIDIPSSVSSIQWSAFYGCNSLKSLYIHDLATWCEMEFSTDPEWEEDSNPLSHGGNLYVNGELISKLVIPSTCTKIGDLAFYNCASIDSVHIPNNITRIGKGAFACCEMTKITIPENVTNIGNSALAIKGLNSVIWNAKNISDVSASPFYYKREHTYPEYVVDARNQISSFVFGDEVNTIPAYICYGMYNLKTVTIPSGVTSIGNYAFSGCNLSSVTCEAIVPPAISNNTFPSKSIPIFVPEESIEAYQNALYWEEFTNIRAIGSAPLVQFLDWDGTILSSANVTIGTAATAPADPTRTGYTFIGWDKDFSNITEDLVVTAQYKINRYEVIFKDWDETILMTDSVDYNTAATAPANPSREGHEFIGWDKDFSHVSSDMIINARYAVNYYPVGFLNYDGTLLSEQSIAYNQAAMEPNVPAREGYTFIGWTADIEHITARTFAIALYEKDGINVTYISEEGDTIVSEKVDMHLPDAPIVSGKTFTGWLTESASNAEGIVFRATYTLDNPTTGEDVVVIPTSSTAGVSFPYITGAMTYMLVIRDLFGTVVCKIMFDADGHLLGITFAPGRNRTQKAQSEGFHFTVEGLTPSTTYEYEFVAYDEADQVIETLSGSFETTADETGVNNISSASAPQKVINDGHVLILRGDKTYTMQGQEVK